MCFDGRKPEAGDLMRAAGLARGGNPPLPALACSASACPACGSTNHTDIALVPPVRTCRDCGWRGYVDVDDGPVPPEDRGIPAWVYRDSDGWWSYWKLPRAVERVEVSVPIGWRLMSNPEHGVVLGNVWGNKLTAVAVLHHAERGEGGFRVRGREAVG